MPWFSSQTGQQVWGDFVAVKAGLFEIFGCALAPIVLVTTLVRVTELSLVLAFTVGYLIMSCASTPHFNQSLKTKSVGSIQFTRCFRTVKSDHDSLILGGDFYTAALISEALFKLASRDSD